MRHGDKAERGWVKRLLEYGRLTELDRPTIAGTINEIKIFEGGRIEISYLFSEELSALLDKDKEV
jgi:site-specific DNA recombinase